MADWQNRGGVVNAGMQLTPLDLNKEHIFELMSVDIQEGVTTKFGIKTKVKLVWKEAAKEKDFHRVWLNYNESYAEKSNLVKFLSSASGKPIVPGIPTTLGDHLTIGMKIKAMVQARIDSKSGLPSGYYDFISASIKPAGSLVLPKQVNDITPAWRQAITQHAKGAKSAGDVWGLVLGKVPQEYIQEFIAADKRGEIKYPIA